MVKYSLGLTAVTMAALTGLYIAGCSEPASQGMGILDPYETSSPMEPGQASTATPTATPTKKVGKELFQNNLTNPTNILTLSAYERASGEAKPYYWTLQYDKQGGADTKLVKIAYDTERGSSKTDAQSPHRIKLIDCDTGNELVLQDAISMAKISNPPIAEYKSGSKRVFAPEYNPNQNYLIISDNVKSASNGRIIMVNPNEHDDGNEDILYAKVLYSGAKNPVKVAVDNKYIWWVECKVDAAVMRMEYISNPDTIAEKEYRTRVWTTGLQYPTNIMTTGGQVYVADTVGNRVFTGPCFNEQKEQVMSTNPVCTYATNQEDGYYMLEGFSQPYAMTLIDSGKLLIADRTINPFVEGPQATGTENQGKLYIWDFKSICEGSEGNEKKGVDVVEIYEGLNNPTQLAVIYDASSETKSQYAHYVDVLVPQYSAVKNNSPMTMIRLNTAYHDSKLVKSKNVFTSDRTTEIFPLRYTRSNDVAPVEPPEKQDLNLEILYNEGILDPVTYSSTIQKYVYDYPL